MTQAYSEGHNAPQDVTDDYGVRASIEDALKTLNQEIDSLETEIISLEQEAENVYTKVIGNHIGDSALSSHSATKYFE